MKPYVCTGPKIKLTREAAISESAGKCADRLIALGMPADMRAKAVEVIDARMQNMANRILCGEMGAAVREPIRRKLSENERRGNKGTRWEEPLPWPPDYSRETHNASPLAHVRQILETGRSRRAVTMKPHA